jgi:PTS system nitrogen regulatory IIA component
MKLSDLVVEEAIIPELQSTDRNGVIREMIHAMAPGIGLDHDTAEEIVQTTIEREKQGSTGFGKGVAVPHVKHSAVKRIGAAVARSSTGIDFAALDRAPVYIVVLLMSPPDNPDRHLTSMENIFRHLQRDSFRRFLRQASTVEEIRELIQEADELPGD